ncbi:hypothetical protein [Bacillus salipaludis]|uniref:Uncharacterized protein n=1 Tax=Bacillus salipaludis TaxID=2547811 RepID=A0AA90QZ16_9BACI|nr:hypothetical protein [Bacillus salipaludis]MDQ6598869.1 hypothetical protein [Bacillus salipaludis]
MVAALEEELSELDREKDELQLMLEKNTNSTKKLKGGHVVLTKLTQEEQILLRNWFQ